MAKQKHYSVEQKAMVLARLDTNGGNVSQTARETTIPRKTIISWRDQRQQIMTDYKEVQNIKLMEVAEKAGLPVKAEQTAVQKSAERKLDHYRQGVTYEEAKSVMGAQLQKIAMDAMNLAEDKLEDMSGKDLMWATGVAIDKLFKVMGEPDVIIEVRNVIKKQIVVVMKDFVDSGRVDSKTAVEILRAVDNISVQPIDQYILIVIYL